MDVAHLGPVELLTPEAEESLRFFVDVFGMEVAGAVATFHTYDTPPVEA